MATVYLSPITEIVQYFTNVGVISAGAQVHTYVAGTPNTPIATYTDNTGLVPNSNPMTLNSAGRPAGSSGAPVAFWAPSGSSIKLVVTDAGGTQIVYLDNLPLINDPLGVGSLQLLLANPASGSGVDLVANAVKSYATFADMRAAPVPSLVAAQTLIVACEGGNAIGDILAGVFYWSASSALAEDGVNVIKPSAAGATGRYLRSLSNETLSTMNVDTSRTNTTTVSIESQLTTPVLQPGRYRVELHLQFDGPAAGGFKFIDAGTRTIGGTNTGVSTGWVNTAAYGPLRSGWISGTEAIATLAAENEVVRSTTQLDITVAGTIAIAYAQNTVNASPTFLRAGSYLRVERIL